MILNVDKNGNIFLDGQPWLFAAFLTRVPVQTAQPFIAALIPYDFTLELANEIVTGKARDFLVKGPDGYFIVPAEEFPKKYKAV